MSDDFRLLYWQIRAHIRFLTDVPQTTESFVYILIDNSDVFYVGQTVDPHTRYAGHIQSRNLSDDKASRIQKIIESGNLPKMLVVDACSKELADEREAYWFEHYRNQGFELLNNKSLDYAKAVEKRRRKELLENIPVRLYVQNQATNIVFDSITQAEKHTNIAAGSILRTCQLIDRYVPRIHHQPNIPINTTGKRLSFKFLETEQN